VKAIITKDRLIKTDGVIGVVTDTTGRDEIIVDCPVIVGNKAPRLIGHLDTIKSNRGFPVDVDRLHQILKEFSGAKVLNVSVGVDGSLFDASKNRRV
jgi:hypothetical protein